MTSWSNLGVCTYHRRGKQTLRYSTRSWKVDNRPLFAAWSHPMATGEKRENRR